MGAKNETASAASATYRKAVNKLAKVLRIAPNHTKRPSEDFESISDLVDDKSKARALQWYKRGLRRGFEEACDAVVSRALELKNGTLYCPNEVIITVRVRFKGSEPESKEFVFSADDLGFK
jgi:hypothetical protein